MSLPHNVITWLQNLTSSWGVFAAVVMPILMILPVYYYISQNVFNKALSNRGGVPPVVPHMFPFIAHTWIFALGENRFASAFLKHIKSGSMVRFKGIGFDFAIPSGPHLIRKALITSNHLDWNRYSAAMFGQLFDAPRIVCHATLVDDSGIAVKPYVGSQVPPGRRIIRNQVIFFNDAFSKKSMDEVVPRFLQNLSLQCAGLAIGAHWNEMNDLFAFVHDLAFPCAVKSFFGESMLRINPNLQIDFPAFEDNVPFLASGMPTWLKPQATQARSRCLDAVKRWRKEAMRNSVDSPQTEDGAWDSAWGLGALRRRNKVFEATEGLFDEQATAATDLATTWAFASNVIPASFWFLFEILKSDDLLEGTKREVKSSKTMTGSIDPTKLVKSPLLQSIYAEVLRLHSASLITRSSKQEHKLDEWIIRKDQGVMVSTHAEHRSSYWDAVDSETSTQHPSSSFYARRFLVRDEKGREEFSIDGKQGRWIPYGMGEHVCPGRHFAKYEMMLVFAVLVDVFDIELKTPAGWAPDDDFKRYGFGVLKPKQKVSFRIRKRGQT